MRGLLDGRGWVEIEDYPEATVWCREQIYTIVDDPEAGSFTADDFEEIDA